MNAALGNRRAAIAVLFIVSCLLAGPLAGRAYADPQLTPDPTEITFDDQIVADAPSPAQTITFTSSGDTAVTLGEFQLSGATPGAFAITSTCPSPGFSLGVGGTCTVSVKFDPTVAGPHSASLTMDLPDPSLDIQILLQGLAIAPEVSTDPSAIEFRPWATNAGPSSPGYVRIHNVGDAPLALGAGTFTGPDASDFAFATDGCSGRVLQPSVFCDVAVTFDPTSPGAKNATLRFANNTATGVTAIPLSSIAFVAPLLPMLTQRVKPPRLTRVKRLVFTVACPSSTCHVTATANLYLPVAGKKKQRRSTLGWKQTIVTGGGTAKIVFKLSGRQRYALADAARRGIAIRADASLSAWSEGYSDATSTLSFKLR